MFMFWSKRAVLTRRLLKAKVRGEHETECETQEDTFSRINSTITSNGTTQQQQQHQRQQQLRQQQQVQQQQQQQQQNTTSRGHNHRSSTSSSTNRVNSVANRFHQGCCGGDLSHDEDDDTQKNNQQQQQQQQQQQSRIQPNRLTRCKDLLKTLKENQLEMLLNVVESYGSDFGSCVLVPRKQTSCSSPGRSSPVEARRRSTSPGLPKQQDSMSQQCNRHQRCGLASTLHENPTRRVSHRHLLRSRRHNPPGARCSRCVSCHTPGNEEQQRVTTGPGGNRDEFASSNTITTTTTDDDDFTVTESRDNEMNLRIVDTTKRSNNGQKNDDPRQEQPAWSAGEDSTATINGNNMPPVGLTCCTGQRLNEEGISRPERDRCRRNHGSKIGRATGRRRRDEANIGDSSGSETSLDSPLDDPHLLSCQIWRWPDLANSSELKKLPVCHSAKDPVYVCCNPYHWSRLCKPESPPPPYCLIPDRLRPEDRAPSEISGDYRRCGITTSPQHHSLTTNGEGGSEMGQKEWCTLAYWELGGRVGRLYPVEPSTVNVFDSLHDGDGLCLATLAENHVASLAVQRTRSKIGLGLMLSQEPDGVWAYNRSESPIFVNSPTLDDPESRTLLVYRVPPGFCLNIFDRAKTYQLPRCHGQGSPTSASFNSGPVDVNSVRISFAKGWGPKYSRQEVTSCPCWLEVLLAPCR